LLLAVLGQHDHAFAVDLGHNPHRLPISTAEAHFQPHAQLAQSLEIFLIVQFVNALADELVQFQQMVDGQIINAHG
jgi:hypothetical protein